MVRGQKRTVINKNIMASIHNRFDIEVVDAATGEIKQKAKAENVILDRIWSVYGQGWFNYIAYGSGRGTPSASDTALFNHAGGANLGSQTIDYSHIKDGYVSYTKTASLEPSTAVGVTITEVGISSGSSTATTLCTHAMLQDMNGNPISILKTSTDIINLYATVFFHWNLDGYGDVEIIPRYNLPIGELSISYVYFSKGKNVGDTTSNGNTTSTYVSASYNADTRTFSITNSRLSVSQMNIGGFQYVMWGAFLVKIAGPHRITGETVATGDGSTSDFATKFDFASNATVYVDGVRATDVQVSDEPLERTKMGRYFWCIDEDSTPDRLIPRRGSNPGSLETRLSGVGLFYNPFYEYGIDSCYVRFITKIEASNDLRNWETVYDDPGNGTLSLSAFRNYKFWRMPSCDGGTASNQGWGDIKCNSLTGKNIHFATPPAAGSVITIDYDTAVVPKDENHVYDFNLQVQVGAYSEI